MLLTYKPKHELDFFFNVYFHLRYKVYVLFVSQRRRSQLLDESLAGCMPIIGRKLFFGYKYWQRRALND